MHLAQIDQLANNGSSFFHRARAISKIFMAALLLTALIISNDLIRLSGLIVIILMMFAAARVSLKEIGHLALYPAFFSLAFALLRLQESWVLAAGIVLKALGAALSMLLLISTTSYLEIFSFFSLFMPALLIDIFLFTYRTFFVLLEQIQHLLKSIRLRGGYHKSNLKENFKNMASSIGVMIIHSIDMSDRMYRIYTLRGYHGRIPMIRKWWPLTWRDGLIGAAAVLILAGTVIPWSI